MIRRPIAWLAVVLPALTAWPLSALALTRVTDEDLRRERRARK